MLRNLGKSHTALRILLLQNHLKYAKSDLPKPPQPHSQQNSNLKSSLKELNFVNTAVKTFPLDENPDNKVRQVSGYNYSKVKPTPRENPCIVSLSASALKLLDLDKEKVEKDPETPLYLTGNKLLPGSEPIAHCYCGHQFGSFAGQLGDGRAITIGDIKNNKGEIWELQLKGAGLTPYSRFADGKAVLRSSIREYLCSEAMWGLGIPSSRAGSVIITDTLADRDPFYDGRAIKERCAVVLRLAPTFWRFGSFEIFKEYDVSSARQGPSAGMEAEMMPKMLNYILDYFYPEISKLRQEKSYSDEQCWMEMFQEIVRRTARLVALWQCYGFCHGVLNTDNMSIVGITIDYGPFGWMDYFNKGHFCNTSDQGGRYSYENQPVACKWNLYKLSEALSSHLPVEKMQEYIEKEYDKLFSAQYYAKMREKLGLDSVESEEDKSLIDSLFDVMHHNASDFTNTFRRLSIVQIPKDPAHSGITSEIIDKFAELSPDIETILSRYKPKFNEEQLSKLKELAKSNVQVLLMLGVSPQDIEVHEQKLKRYNEMLQGDQQVKLSEVKKRWSEWLKLYELRLYKETLGLESSEKADKEQLEGLKVNKSYHNVDELRQYRVNRMNQTNPVYVLRNYMAQEVIEKAEQGDFKAVDDLLGLLLSPFEEREEVKTQEYQKCRPRWANGICVSCSS